MDNSDLNLTVKTNEILTVNTFCAEHLSFRNHMSEKLIVNKENIIKLMFKMINIYIKPAAGQRFLIT